MNEQLQDIARRWQSGEKVSPEEFAYLITNSREAFFAFMIQNNPGSMNHVLRNLLKYTYELPFTPDVKKIGRICQVMLEADKQADIRTVLDNFQFNLDKISPRLLAAIKLAQQ